MRGDGGYVKTYRSIVDWEWFTDPKTAHLWEYLRVRAQWEDSQWRGIIIRRGQLLESIRSISTNTGLSTQSVRTALAHLQMTGEITCEVTHLGMLVSIVKYADFQDLCSDTNTQINTQSTHKSTRELTGNQHANQHADQHSNKKLRNKEEKEINKERVAPTLDEIKQFVKEEKLTISPERFFRFYEGQDWRTSGGTPIRDWKAKAREWQSTERQSKTEVLPEYYNPEPIREKSGDSRQRKKSNGRELCSTKEGQHMKNKIQDLNDHLFAQLERLNDEDLTQEQLEKEIQRSKAVTAVSNQIINNAKLALDATRLQVEYRTPTRGKVALPEMLETKKDAARKV